MPLTAVLEMVLTLGLMPTIESTHTHLVEQAVHNHYRSALAAYERSLVEYRIGRLLPDDFLSCSKRLMEAQYRLAHTSSARIAAISAHVERAAAVVREEKSLFVCNHAADIRIAEQFLEEAEARLTEEMTRSR